MAAIATPARATQIALLYELWTLDVVTDVGVACGSLFAGRAQQFKNVGRAMPDSMAGLRYRIGNDDQHLDATQRSELCDPLLGASDGTRHDFTGSAFHEAAAAVRQAAVDFERLDQYRSVPAQVSGLRPRSVRRGREAQSAAERRVAARWTRSRASRRMLSRRSPGSA
jgi:hypothetical protein